MNTSKNDKIFNMSVIKDIPYPPCIKSVKSSKTTVHSMRSRPQSSNHTKNVIIKDIDNATMRQFYSNEYRLAPSTGSKGTSIYGDKNGASQIKN